jgi:hypothetical protein
VLPKTVAAALLQHSEPACQYSLMPMSDERDEKLKIRQLLAVAYDAITPSSYGCCHVTEIVG